MLRTLLLLALAATLAACQPTGTDDPVIEEVDTDAASPSAAVSATLTVSDPFVPAAPSGGTGGVFMTLTGGAAADTLVGVRTEVSERAEVHETYDTGDGLRGMREVEAGIPVPAGGTVALAPGSYHVMLMGLSRALAVGDTVDVELDFAVGGALAVRVPVVSLDAMPRPSAE